MKLKVKNSVLMQLVGLCLAFGFSRLVYADIGYSSRVGVDYAINRVTNSAGELITDFSLLPIIGSLQRLADSNNDYGITSGDGVFKVNNPDQVSSAVPSGYSGSFAVTGSSGWSGTVDTLHTALFSLAISNHSATSYQFDISMNYDLTAAVTGIFANSSIQLDYWDDTANLVADNQDNLNVAAFPGVEAASQTKSGRYDFVFNLDAGASEHIMLQAAINSHLDSTANATYVPLPAAVWSFLFGLTGLFWIGKPRPK